MSEQQNDNFKKYPGELGKAKYLVDTKTLSKSYRCSPEICEFVADNLGIHIESHKTTPENIDFIDSSKGVDALFMNDNIVKPFYQSSNKYPDNSDNWGNVKALDDFEDVCVVLNPTTLKAFKETPLADMASSKKIKEI